MSSTSHRIVRAARIMAAEWGELRTVGFAVMVAVIAAGLLAHGADAQVLRSSASDSITRKVDSIAPVSGPAGTEVRVASGSMPARTPLRIGFGATTGFEELEMVLTTDAGEFELTARVPAWASWERSYRFIVFDVYFRPIALSQPFLATDRNGNIFREGRVEREPTGCLVLRELNGDVHALTGDTTRVVPGERAAVEGVPSGPSPCSNGVLIRVTSTRGPPGPG